MVFSDHMNKYAIILTIPLVEFGFIFSPQLIPTLSMMIDILVYKSSL